MNAVRWCRVDFFFRQTSHVVEGDGVSLNQLSLCSDLASWERWEGQDSNLRSIHAERFAAGHRVLVVHQQEKLLHRQWVASGRLRVDEIGRTWTIATNACWIYDVLTVPEERGRGWYRRSLRTIVQLLAGEGIETIWIYSETDNAASIAGIRAAGFEFHERWGGLHIGNKVPLRLRLLHGTAS